MIKSPHRVLHGIPVSPGVAHGTVFVHDAGKVPVKRRVIPDNKVEEEIARFNQAVARTRQQLQKTRQMVNAKLDKVHAAIFEAQEVLLDDPLLIDICRRDIREQKLNAEFILEQSVQNLRKLFEQFETPNTSVQNLDMLDVTSRLRENLSPGTTSRIDNLPKNAIIVARNLHPSDTATLSRRHVLGIVTETGGRTAHFAILAKALGIPAVVGLEGVLSHVQQGDSMIIDGYAGRVVLQPSRQDLERLRQRRQRLKVEGESLSRLRDLPCETTDNYKVRLAANMEFPSELGAIKNAGARGIGLFRTEFFYIDRGQVPSEEEQFQVYRQVLEEMAPLPVTIRTLDLGGDKLIAPSATPDGNPFLGMRSIRLCLAHPDMFRVQLRAILRASAFGNARIMFPLVTDVAEVRQAKEIIYDVQKELRRRGIDFSTDVQIGSMIETPAAALTSEHLASEVDFFSIGTNDLIQYTLAVDRATESLGALYNPLHPSVIQLIRKTIDSAHQAGIPVAVCGEIAADPAMAVLLIGLGIDELSMSPPAIPEVKRLIRSLSLDDIRQLRSDVLSHLQAGQARTIIDRFLRTHSARTRRGR